MRGILEHCRYGAASGSCWTRSKRLWIQKLWFYPDRGYFSKANIRFMDKNGYDFIIMVKGMKSLVRDLIMEKRGTLEEVRANSIRQYKTYGTTIERPLFASDEKNRYFHLFYSIQRHASEQEHLEARIDRMKKNLKKLYGKAAELPREYQHYFKPIYFHEGQEDQLLQLAMENSDAIEEGDPSVRLFLYCHFPQNDSEGGSGIV